MPKKVLILVEGFTEEGFIKKVLGPYLFTKNIFLIPTIIKTKREISGPDYKGGVNSYNQVTRDLLPLLNDTSADIVTTMIDYYALPNDFPGYIDRPAGTCYKRVEFMEEQFSLNINRTKFLPYLQLHEFEALIFASEETISAAFIYVPSKLSLVSAVNNSFASPEEINEDPSLAPSKRLKNIFPDYEKIFHSQLILLQANVDNLRARCNHFNSWLTKLEN
ncbi:MAG: DUF4276 family protein [Ignavibacteriaceae bacterium]